MCHTNKQEKTAKHSFELSFVDIFKFVRNGFRFRRSPLLMLLNAPISVWHSNSRMHYTVMCRIQSLMHVFVCIYMRVARTRDQATSTRHSKVEMGFQRKHQMKGSLIERHAALRCKYVICTHRLHSNVVLFDI